MSVDNWFLVNPFGPGPRTIEVIYTGTTGGGYTNLDGEPTFPLPTSGTVARIVIEPPGITSVWQLVASTHVDDPANGWKRPLDFDPSANKKVWHRTTFFGGGGGTGGDKNYVHVQNLAADTWVIFHNLGKYPAIDVIDSAGSVVIGEISHMDLNSSMVTFSVPFGGVATCN
ncbi:MAG TPA: hypothetical protein VFH87_07805 [Candidatus Udaeobacter sp.]|nr:hypothetical protein [Candidatus Udaeobacter sp.]HET6887814.1 hypothetical protein [Candidatus Udaeobacter sp.]